MPDQAISDNVPAKRQRPGLLEILAVQGRVILAIFLRETRTRFGSSMIGYSWAILEPVFNIAIWVLFFHALGRHPPLNVHVVEFLITGVLPIFLFRDITTYLAAAITANRALLKFPIVHNYDVMLARALLELTNFFTLFFLAMAVFFAFDLQYWPARPLEFLTVVCALWLYSFGIGSINAVMSCIFSSWAKTVPWYNRVVYMTSGIFFVPEFLPPFVQEVLWYLPMAHIVDWMRQATFSQYHSKMLSQEFVWGCAMAALFTGLALERAFRRKISIEQ